METLASYMFYSYVATILFIVNILFISFTRKDIIKPITALGIIIFIILFVNLTIYNPFNQLDYIWEVDFPSYREFVMNLLIASFLIILLKKMKYKILFIISLLLWSGLLITLFFLIQTYNSLFYYSIVVDFFGILVTIAVTIETLKTKNYILFAIYHCFCPILSMLIMILWLPMVVSPFPKIPYDLRGNEIICIFNSSRWEERDPQDVVCELHNTIDTEKRFAKIIDFVKKCKGNIHFQFIEDTLAAFNFYRSTYIIHDDSIFPHDAYPKLIINYHNSRFKDCFEYHCDSTSFNIVSTDDNLINVEGDFDDLTLKRFCALQKYLNQDFSNLSNYKISLYNRDNEFKLGIRYYENDEYMLYLDESFLDDKNSTEK